MVYFRNFHGIGIGLHKIPLWSEGLKWQALEVIFSDCYRWYVILVVKGRGHLLYPKATWCGGWKIKLGVKRPMFQLKLCHIPVLWQRDYEKSLRNCFLTGQKEGKCCSLLARLFNIILEVLATTTKKNTSINKWINKWHPHYKWSKIVTICRSHYIIFREP